MPLTAKGNEIRSAMEKQYGTEKGKQVFYASKNKGTISGVDADAQVTSAWDPTTEKVPHPYGKDNPIHAFASKVDAVMAACDALCERIEKLPP
jgi:hypothetical protein